MKSIDVMYIGIGLGALFFGLSYLPEEVLLMALILLFFLAVGVFS